jgi:hypothetical protein
MISPQYPIILVDALLTQIIIMRIGNMLFGPDMCQLCATDGCGPDDFWHMFAQPPYRENVSLQAASEENDGNVVLCMKFSRNERNEMTTSIAEAVHRMSRSFIPTTEPQSDSICCPLWKIRDLF